MGGGNLGGWIQLFIMGIIFFGIPNYFLAKRKGKNQWLALAMGAIPVANYFALLALIMMTDAETNERLHKLEQAVEALGQSENDQVIAKLEQHQKLLDELLKKKPRKK